MRVSVIKIGGSVLTGPAAYRRTAAFVAARLHETPGDRLVVVVSAEHGTTDALLETAQGIVAEPDPATLDLLWSTGETRAAALLVLWLHAAGVRAAAVNVHQAGLVEPDAAGVPGRSQLRALRLKSVLAHHDVVVAPGFLARGAGDSIVSLGRGGSDLTAVLLAAGLGATRCELVKDVAGYFSADPNEDPSAQQLPAITIDRAIAMAEAGCELVQLDALETARERRLPLVVRSLDGQRATIVEPALADVVERRGTATANERAWEWGRLLTSIGAPPTAPKASGVKQRRRRVSARGGGAPRALIKENKRWSSLPGRFTPPSRRSQGRDHSSRRSSRHPPTSRMRRV